MTNENFNDICNWDNLFKQSEIFKNNKPFKFAFIEEILKRDFYEKLINTYPQYDNKDKKWISSTQFSKFQFIRAWGNFKPMEPNLEIVEDPDISPEWNRFYKFLHSQEFIENMKKFSGISVNRLKSFRFTLFHKGGFQLPHIHNDGPSTLIIFFNFSKGWEKGDPGGTYVASEENESKIIFEPYNLDNTMTILQDGPYSAHGARYITKDVKRQALQIYLEEYSKEKGWSGKGFESIQPKIEL